MDESVAAAGEGCDEITIATLRGWFEEHARHWPEPDDDVLAPIMLACNWEKQRQAMLKGVRAEPKEMLDSEAVQRARTGANMLQNELPALLNVIETRRQNTADVIEEQRTRDSADRQSAPWALWRREDDEAVEALSQLERALRHAQPFLEPRRQRGGQPNDWDEFATQIAVYLWAVLIQNGLRASFTKAEGPLVRLLQSIIGFVFGITPPTKAAIAGVLKRRMAQGGQDGRDATKRWRAQEERMKAAIKR